jgi:hypothetical protein
VPLKISEFLDVGCSQLVQLVVHLSLHVVKEVKDYMLKLENKLQENSDYTEEKSDIVFRISKSLYLEQAAASFLFLHSHSSDLFIISNHLHPIHHSPFHSQNDFAFPHSHSSHLLIIFQTRRTKVIGRSIN